MRGFLNEIKNVAINRATNRLRSVVNEVLGGGSGLPMNRGNVLPSHKNRFGRPNPFDGEMVITQKIWSLVKVIISYSISMNK